MTNLDELRQKKELAAQNLINALQGDDTDEAKKAFVEFQDSIAAQVSAKIEAKNEKGDDDALKARGQKPLTAEEKTYFRKLRDALKSGNPKDTLTGLDVALPETEVNRVFEDLKEEHPLLSEINFQNAGAITKLVYNDSGRPIGAWGKLDAAISSEQSIALASLSLTDCKYSAYIPIPKGYLDESEAWLEQYVRAYLQECIYNGIEDAIINGDGNNKPTGMKRKCGKGASRTDNAFAVKTATTVTSLDAATYGLLLSDISKNDNSVQVGVKNLVLIVNPTDYYTKIMPATTYLTQNGIYAHDVLPVPTKIIVSNYIESGKAILGDASRYFFAVGTAGRGGRIEYSDDAKFLDDDRTYLCRLYANGTPLDNKAFAYLDISGLKAPVQKVEVTNIADAKATLTIPTDNT